MLRTQISLTEQQMGALREVARRRGTSIAAVVREALDQALSDDAQRRRIRLAVEAVSKLEQGSGRADIAREHDRYVADAFDG